MRVKSFDSTRVFCWRASNLEVYNNNMECGIFLLLLTHFLLVRAADDAVDSTQVKAGNVSTVNECYWSGEGPICDGKCRAGETVASESKKNDGNGCIIGKKMYCCKGGGAVLSSKNGTEAVALHHVKRQHVIEVTNSSSTQGQLLLGDTKDDCYWVGKSPNCKGSCLEGDYMVNTSRTANGSTCIVGKKKYCCKGSGTNNTLNDVHSTHSDSSSSTTEAAPVKQMTNGNSSSSCYWVGKAPICLGSCKFGDYVADKSPTGDGGGKCESGQKKFCCARQQSTAPVSTEEPPPPLKTTTSIGQMGNVNNSISNWTSARPFQTRRRPTPRGLPINSTVTNRVKIVKIKRKLVMSTPTVANVSTSISMTSETSSTLAMAQSLLTLPSTTESTVTTTATTPSTTTESTTPTTITASTTAATTTESTTASTTTTIATPTATPTTESTTTASTTSSTPTTESTSTTTAKTPLTTTTASTTTASATTTTESTTTATAATTPSTTAPPTITTTATTTTPSTTIASTTESTTPTIAATTTSSTTTALATTESTTTPSTTATPTTTTESTTIETGTTFSTPIRHPIHHRIRHPTTLATRSTSTATESTSLATGPSTPASTSIKPTLARAPKKFEPFFNLPDVLPVPLIFRIQKSADTDITSLAANIATTSIIQSSTTSTTPTTLE